jgi:hypothetical protein
MTTPAKRPLRGQKFLLSEVYNLMLRDSPHFSILLEDADRVTRDACIQNSHLTEEEMLSVPGFKDTQWVYVRETYEWIPIFQYASSNERPITDFVDYGRSTFEYVDDYFWVTPKGFPRDQE